MVKHFITLGLFIWVATSIAAPEISKDQTLEAQEFKLEKPRDQQKPDRTVATEKKAKRQVDEKDEWSAEEKEKDLKYWKYSEE